MDDAELLRPSYFIRMLSSPTPFGVTLAIVRGTIARVFQFAKAFYAGFSMDGGTSPALIDLRLVDE